MVSYWHRRVDVGPGCVLHTEVLAECNHNLQRAMKTRGCRVDGLGGSCGDVGLGCELRASSFAFRVSSLECPRRRTVCVL